MMITVIMMGSDINATVDLSLDSVSWMEDIYYNSDYRVVAQTEATHRGTRVHFKNGDVLDLRTTRTDISILRDKELMGL